MYETMQQNFSEACNIAIQYKKEHPTVTKSELDKRLAPIELPSTLIQEARKLALSRYEDWKKNEK
ncbi:hypothetical protein ACTXGU_22420, partial [Niallia sp. 01092]